MNDSKIYTIFPEQNNIFNYVTFKCSKNELNTMLRNDEMIGEDENWEETDWIVFEDGIMIQG